jgi:preprotein translocase subunit SecB
MSSGIDSVLRLSDFRVMKSYFEVLPTASSFDKTVLHLAVDIAVLQSGEAADDMAVQLTINLNGEDDAYESSGFTGSVMVTGFFDTAALKQERPDDWEPVLVYNAITVLFGTVRTVYADLSAASPAGRIVLPAVNVSQILDRDAESRRSGAPGSVRQK